MFVSLSFAQVDGSQRQWEEDPDCIVFGGRAGREGGVARKSEKRAEEEAPGAEDETTALQPFLQESESIRGDALYDMNL